MVVLTFRVKLKNYNMRRSINSLIGYTMQATDGEIGEVREFYFDDQSWTVRYLIVKTGFWLFGRKVLISPQALQPTDWDNREFPVNLSKEQIRHSPDIDTDEPVSRQQEELLHAYYPWQGYWVGGLYGVGAWGIMSTAPVRNETQDWRTEHRPGGDTHLRSTERVTGYRILANDGEFGKVINYIVDDTSWEILFLVIKLGTMTNPKRVIISTKWIKEVRWSDSSILVDVSIDKVNASPVYDETTYVDSPYEQLIFDHFGKPLEATKVEMQLK
jgi:hypothetical protein